MFCTNAYTAGLVSSYGSLITPVRITASHISIPSSSEPTTGYLLNTYGITHTKEDSLGRDYLIPRPDGGIVVGGGKNTYSGDKSLWYRVWDDSKLIEPAVEWFKGGGESGRGRYMQRNFLGWENSGAEMDMIWTGSESEGSNQYHLALTDSKLLGKQSLDTLPIRELIVDDFLIPIISSLLRDSMELVWSRSGSLGKVWLEWCSTIR